MVDLMYYPKKGDKIFLKNDILSHIGKDLLIRKGEELEVLNVNKHMITVRTSKGRQQTIRNIPERTIPATEMGKAIYG